jgi:hypothetical protein
MSQPERIEQGTVAAINDRGVKLGEVWFNWSKFAEVARPEVGQEVELLIRGDRWVQGCRVLGADGTPAADDDDPGSWGYGPGTGSAAPRPVRQAAPVQAPAAPVKATSKATLKAAALAAAAHFHSGRAGEEGAEDDVYGTALRFLAFLEDSE